MQNINPNWDSNTNTSKWNTINIIKCTRLIIQSSQQYTFIVGDIQFLVSLNNYIKVIPRILIYVGIQTFVYTYIYMTFD